MIDAYIGRLVGQAISGLKTQDPLLRELQSWFSALLERAPGKWRAVVMSGIACSDPRCARPAIGGCAVCKVPTCLGHAMISAHAEVVCFRCVREAMAAKGVKTPVVQEDMEEVRKGHLKTLGLKDGATLEEIKKAFQRLAVKWHPDRQPPSKKEAAAKKFKTLSAAYHWLIEHINTQENAA